MKIHQIQNVITILKFSKCTIFFYEIFLENSYNGEKCKSFMQWTCRSVVDNLNYCAIVRGQDNVENND